MPLSTMLSLHISMTVLSISIEIYHRKTPISASKNSTFNSIYLQQYHQLFIRLFTFRP